jgi:alanine-glyoxylate transaminase / serine-glyoxylate transaminase / serine-pyruvate transaminase
VTLRSGRHFLHIPGPTNVPDRILRAMDRPTIDHRGPEFQALALGIFRGLQRLFETREAVVIYAASGTGAWEAALVNTLSPGDQVLMFETGHFATLWRDMAQRLGLAVHWVEGDWRRGVDAGLVAAKLAADAQREIKAVLMVHNETSTGVLSRVADVRHAIDQAEHPALLMVDTISSLASVDYQHAAWGVDVTVAGSQKGLMLPPGLSFNAISAKALERSRSARLPKSFWAWEPMLSANRDGWFPHTPATNLLYGLEQALAMLEEEGKENVYARHQRLAEATRRAVRAWGLEILCADATQYSSTLTAVVLPSGHDSDRLREIILQRFDLSLGQGLGRTRGQVFRIGHLGSVNELMLLAALSGVEMGLNLAGVPYRAGGVTAAMDYLAGAPARA